MTCGLLSHQNHLVYFTSVLPKKVIGHFSGMCVFVTMAVESLHFAQFTHSCLCSSLSAQQGVF